MCVIWGTTVRWRGHSTRGGGYRSEVALDVLEGRLKDLDSELAASRFRVWGCLALVHDTSAEKISPHAIPSVFLGFPEDSSDFTFYHPPLHRFFYSRDVRFDESVPYYVRYPCRGLPHPSSSHPTAHPTGAGVRGEDPGGASSRGVGVGAESIPVRGPGLGGAGVEAEPVPAGASSPRGANVRAARVGASGERAGAAAAGATAAGGAAAAAAGAAAAAAAGGAGAAAAARAAVAAAAAAGAAAAAAAAAGAAAAATSASCLWSSDPRSPLSFSSPLPLSPCLWSHGLGPLSGELPWTKKWPPTDPQAPTLTRFPPPGANVVDGMWIFRVKQPPRSPMVFKVWLRHPSAFTGTFPPGTQWRLRRPVYGLRQAPCEWHDTLCSTLLDLGFQPSSADPSLFVRRGSTPFFVLVYVDDLVFATADRVALADMKHKLQRRHTCTDLGELHHYLGLQITRD
ncbi:unnamed protein product [Closterium sp. NIES-53]